MARRPVHEAPRTLAKQQRAFRRTIVLLGRRVRELRHQRGWSFADLAEMSGIHARQLQRLENDPVAMNPTLASLTSLAEALGVDVRDLLTPAQSGVRPKSAAGAPEAPAPAPAPVLPIDLPRSGLRKKRTASK